MLFQLIPCRAEQLQWQNPDYLISSFFKIALQNEHGKSDHRLHKWQQPIHYRIIDRTGDKTLHAMLVQKHLQQLSQITGVDIHAVKKSDNTNLKILFSSEQDLEQDLKIGFGISNEKIRNELMRNSVCSAHFQVNHHNEISSAMVIIPVDRARAHGKLMSCVVEELTQVMGLPNDSDDVFPSIFNDRSYNQFLTGLDYVLLKLLYQPTVKSGMTQQQLHNILSGLLSKTEFHELIHHAEQKVREDSLENLLNE